jgi:hypothetical protein
VNELFDEEEEKTAILVYVSLTLSPIRQDSIPSQTQTRLKKQYYARGVVGTSVESSHAVR